MIIGLDFDNTIVCYDHIIHSAALERGLIPTHIRVSKNSIRDYLRGQDKNDLWTELQGYVYGPGLKDALPYPGVKEFCHICERRQIELHIVSHRTRYPLRGPAYDLHRSAVDWLHQFGFCGESKGSFTWQQIHLELTKAAKLQRIAQLECSVFVDDLPEFLAEPEFPIGVGRVLFDPNGSHSNEHRFVRLSSWHELRDVVLSRD